MVQIDLPEGVVEEPRKQGYAYYFRWRWRKDGKRRTRKIRLPHPFDPRFKQAYDAARKKAAGGGESSGPAPGTVDAMIAAFLESPRFRTKVKSESAQSKYREAYRRLSATFGDRPVADVRGPHMIAFIESMEDTPAMANRVLSCCSIAWNWAIPRGLATANPCAGTDRFAEEGKASPWPIEEVVRAVAEMRPEIANAVALAFYTAQRKSDLLQLKPADVRDGGVEIIQGKTGARVWVELGDHALEILEALWPGDGGPFLRNGRGAAWSPQGFTDAFAKEREKIGLDPMYRFHDLRHSAATAAEEARPGVATALLGHADARTTARYTAALRQRRQVAGVAELLPSLKPATK